MPRVATIVVFDEYAMCSACRWGADPSEPTHKTLINGFKGEGCGATFTAIAMVGTPTEERYEAIEALQPALPFVDWLP
jgi:hypothetical protein